jgi:hypothetical protein
MVVEGLVMVDLPEGRRAEAWRGLIDIIPHGKFKCNEEIIC